MSPRNKKSKSLASPKKQLGQAKRKLITMTKNDAFFRDYVRWQLSVKRKSTAAENEKNY